MSEIDWGNRPDWATHYCMAHKSWRNSVIDTIDDCCIPCPTRKDWEGGLPPVGVRCFGKHKEFNSNFECLINGYCDGKVWFTDFMGTLQREFVYSLDAVEFRPLKSFHKRQRDYI